MASESPGEWLGPEDPQPKQSKLFLNQGIEIHATAIIHDRVVLNQGTSIGAYVLLGESAPGRLEDSRMTIIGPFTHIRSHTVIYFGTQIGSYFSTGHHALIRENNDIGDEVSVGSGSIIEHHVIIKDRVRLHSRVYVPEYSILEDDCWLGPNVVLTNAKYPNSPEAKKSLKGAHIMSHARIGANSTLLPGITVGRHALVGAGSLVTEDVPDYAVMAGCPARQIKDIRELPAYQIKD